MKYNEVLVRNEKKYKMNLEKREKRGITYTLAYKQAPSSPHIQPYKLTYSVGHTTASLNYNSDQVILKKQKIGEPWMSLRERHWHLSFL